ncbi:MAG: ribosome-associated heat shock protein Hsp15 [Gammaproteobacteria bacterium]|nr:ribosome-associated heat shock protein Hsp15 [Gammaproteobacteria bacterium]
MAVDTAVRVRLDKWLWAARFFKTRSLAKAAIEGGKVQINGQRAKPSKEIEQGVTLTIHQGWEEKTVVVTALSEQRRGAAEAALLYAETPESLAQREQKAAARRAARAGVQYPDERPSKKQRRQIIQFRGLDFSDPA